MKKLLVFLLFLSTLTYGQSDPDQKLRARFGYGFSPKKFTQADSLLNRDNATKVVSLSTNQATQQAQLDANTTGVNSATNTATSAFSLVTSQLVQNLFNQGSTKDGYYLNEQNQEFANATYCYSDYIPVSPVRYNASVSGVATTMRFITFYDKNKTFVTGGYSYAVVGFTPPQNVAYVRITVLLSQKSTFQLQVGAVSGYVPYGLTSLSEAVAIPTATVDVMRTTSSVAIAPKLYAATGKEIQIYSENVQKNYPHYRDKMEVSINHALAITTDRGARLKTNTPGSYSGTVTVADNQYNTISTIPFSISVVSLTATTPWKQLNIGDSYTYRSTFANSFSATTNVTFLGTRISSASSASVLCEGRGGFTIAQYTTHSTTLYMPFMQPTATYLYLGNTSFWIAANAGLSDAVGQGYDYNRFVNANQFNPSTGYPTSPRVNDLIYDNSLSQYKAWNGTSWATVGTPTFAFSFAKYRQCWNIAQPDGVQILLGTNDNANANETTFPTAYTTFKAALDVMIASIQADSPNARIAIGIPNSSARMGETETLTTGRRKGAYWNHTNRLIIDYSGKESQRIYVLDYHSTVDRVFGYTRTLSKPFEAYSGTETVPIVSDFTHISSDGFTQIGDQLLGWIQSFR